MAPKNRSELSAEFLFYRLDAMYQELRGITGDKDRRGLNMPILREIEIRYPTLREQQRIVALLDRAFGGTATATANAEKNLLNCRAILESYRDAVLAHGGDGWDERPLSALCDIRHGFAFLGEFFSDRGEFVLLTPGNFHESGGYRDRGAKQKFYTGTIPDGYLLAEGDLLVAMTEQAAGLLGSPILIPESGKFLHNQRLGLVTKKLDAPWTNEFFFHVFNTPGVRRAIHSSASGVKVRHTSPTKIGDVVVAFPTSISEQQRIAGSLAKVAAGAEHLYSLYGRKLAALDELKASLLHEAFSGNL
jgi:type I restriction enzyme S subunit